MSRFSFPPVVASRKWTVKSESNWPGAEYTRRLRLRTTCVESFAPEFLDELQATLGEENFLIFQQALKPTASSQMQRGKPPAESGVKSIKPPYKLQRPCTEGEERRLLHTSRASTTLSLSGQPSRSKFLESFCTKYGAAPSYMFEDREKVLTSANNMANTTSLNSPQTQRPASPWKRLLPVAVVRNAACLCFACALLLRIALLPLQMISLQEWFEKYGRPEPNVLNKRLYTSWESSRKRCCGEPSQVQVMKKGSLTN